MAKNTLRERIDLRVDEDLRRELQARARREHRSEGAIVRAILRRHLAADNQALVRLLHDVNEA